MRSMETENTNHPHTGPYSPASNAAGRSRDRRERQVRNWDCILFAQAWGTLFEGRKGEGTAVTFLPPGDGVDWGGQSGGGKGKAGRREAGVFGKGWERV